MTSLPKAYDTILYILHYLIERAEYIVLYVSLSCFCLSFLLRFFQGNKKQKNKKNQLNDLSLYLTQLSRSDLPEISGCSFKSFYLFFVRHKNQQISVDLLPRWKELSHYLLRSEWFLKSFSKASNSKKIKYIHSFEFFPYFLNQSKCLEWMILNNKQKLIWEAVIVWSRLPYKVSWSFIMVALAFLNKMDMAFIKETIEPKMYEHLDFNSSNSMDLFPLNSYLQKIKGFYLDCFNHHDIILQNLGIYGSAFFKSNTIVPLLVSRLDTVDSKRFNLIIEALHQFSNQNTLESLYFWASNISYPSWEMMEIIHEFYIKESAKGEIWIKKLRENPNSFWNNFFQQKTT